MRPMVRNRDLAVAFDLPEDPVPVLGDAVQLERVMLNLLSNAVKFTPDQRPGLDPAVARGRRGLADRRRQRHRHPAGGAGRPVPEVLPLLDRAGDGDPGHRPRPVDRGRHRGRPRRADRRRLRGSARGPRSRCGSRCTWRDPGPSATSALGQDDRMALEVRTGSGTGFELLVAAAAVADPDWRRVFTHGQAAYDAARAADPGLPAHARRFGRFGWINLAGPLASAKPPWTRHRLRPAGGGHQPRRPRARAGRRPPPPAPEPARRRHRPRGRGRRPGRRPPAPRHGRRDAAERQPVAAAHRPGDEVQGRLPAGAGRRCRRSTRRAPSTATIDEALAELGGARLLERVAPGIHYGPDVLGRVTLVTSLRTAPILVSVDEVDQTVILHPPLTRDGTTDAAAQLRELGRALGDDTRIRILQELRAADLTLADLCTALDSPRTTLLHHLALLRSAGLIDLTGPGRRAERLRAREPGLRHPRRRCPGVHNSVTVCRKISTRRSRRALVSRHEDVAAVAVTRCRHPAPGPRGLRR